MGPGRPLQSPDLTMAHPSLPQSITHQLKNLEPKLLARYENLPDHQRWTTRTCLLSPQGLGKEATLWGFILLAARLGPACWFAQAVTQSAPGWPASGGWSPSSGWQQDWLHRGPSPWGADSPLRAVSPHAHPLDTCCPSACPDLPFS